jgi:hypothetical protein
MSQIDEHKKIRAAIVNFPASRTHERGRQPLQWAAGEWGREWRPLSLVTDEFYDM